MITMALLLTALLLTFIGLLIWLIFSKANIADPWMAEVGRLVFFAGLLAWLLSMGSKLLI